MSLCVNLWNHFAAGFLLHSIPTQAITWETILNSDNDAGGK